MNPAKLNMNTLVPNRFLCDFEFPLSYRDPPPTIDGNLNDWTDVERLPAFSALDGIVEFAEVWACWNERGLGIACRVSNKKKTLRCDPKGYWTGDNLRLCTDMRDARSNKRATRYCQQFYFLAAGGGPRRDQPVAGVGELQRAREHAPKASASLHK